jgi:dihydrofolate synthase/folylpolyglutamate synthase
LSRQTDADWARLAEQVEAELLQRVPENNIRPRLEPTRRAAELMGDPQKSFRVIHVTGTNGKTSTTRFIERILREHGLRTGRFTSPHLVKLNERIAVDGEPVSDQVLWELWEDTKPVLQIVDAELAGQGEEPLTFFEALTVLGFAIFADAPIDVLVLEVGMGGTWDSTNVADGDVAVFTPIGLDHTDRLGNTLTEIADTKSGIIKPGAIVVSALQPAEARQVLVSVSNELAESMVQFGGDFAIVDHQNEGFGQRFTLRGLAGEYRDLFLPLLGLHQLENVAVAVAAVEAFLGGGKQRILDDILRVALADASSPGRLQILSRQPLIVLDAAHNPHGAAVLAGALQNSFDAKRFVGVVGVLGEKDAAGLLRALEPVLEEIIVTKSSSPRSLAVDDLADLASEIFGEHRVHVAHGIASALQDAQQLLGEGLADAIVVSGSITLVGDVLRMQQIEDEILGDDSEDRSENDIDDDWSPFDEENTVSRDLGDNDGE